VFAAARDITELKKLERELERQAHIDPLTELNNRRQFMELAEQEFARSRRHSKPLSLLMMDLDNFKMVNDTYGHEMGDATLQKLSEICRHTFREIDIVGRLGGEEFAALLPETNIEQAVEVAERLRTAIENAAVNLEDGSLIHFTVSIGVAGFGVEDEKIETVLKRADTALYKAKNSGRNRVCGNDID
jgi:diguanylate cyclase (GGDEF)-like protein